jgi:hypothetical protein
MNEHQLGRLLRRWVLLSAPLPLAVLGAACGGSTSTIDSEGSGGTTAQGGTDAAGTASGGSRAGAGTGGSVVVAGAGGTISQAGSGGTISQAGSGGTISQAGSGGTISQAGSGGSISMAGAGGGTCRGTVRDVTCAPFQNTVPRSCVADTSPVAGTPLPFESCMAICSTNVPCTVALVADGFVTALCQPSCGGVGGAVGRRPAGLSGPSTCDTRAAGSYFAEIAHLEAASVTAFRILRDELRAKGAPKRLVRAAARAARDEIRHARATGALARRFGAQPRVPVIEAVKPRSLEAMAVENVVEGCVRETYGALLATRQAALATDPVVRAAMMRIAHDETRHASLSWQVGRWLETRLAPAAKRSVARAKHAAAAELIEALANEPEVSFAALAGLPSAAEATHLARQMQRELWA